MSLDVKISYDIEDEVRKALNGYLTAYCRPYPAEPVFPNVLAQAAGGYDDHGDIDHTTIVLDARAETEAEAYYTLRVAIGALRTIAANQTTPIRDVTVNSAGTWGRDPNNPTVALATANLSITSHKQKTTIQPKQGGNNS